MDKTLRKLRKVEGQVVGVRRMYEEGRDCLEIVQQLAAIRSAAAGVGRDLLSGEAKKCARLQKTENFDRILKLLFEFS